PQGGARWPAPPRAESGTASGRLLTGTEADGMAPGLVRVSLDPGLGQGTGLRGERVQQRMEAAQRGLGVTSPYWTKVQYHPPLPLAIMRRKGDSSGPGRCGFGPAAVRLGPRRQSIPSSRLCPV